MATKKKEVKVSDLKPMKDAKGGAARSNSSSRNQNAAGRSQNSSRGNTNAGGRVMQ